MPLVLRPRDRVLAADLTGITPDRLAGISVAALTRLALPAGPPGTALGELFTVSGSASDGVIECHGDLSRCHGVGAGMAAGRIVVHGDVGTGAALGMIGGRLEVVGRAGAWLAAGMSGGCVHVAGDAADDVAAALPGAERGVSGGTVIVEGSVGQRAGCRMRRGVVAVGGDCGPAAGLELRAGTILVVGRLAADAGCGMRRGSIVALGEAAPPGPNFLPGNAWRPTVLGLLIRHLAGVGFAPARTAPAAFRGPFRQWHGDTLAGGRGELLLGAGA